MYGTLRGMDSSPRSRANPQIAKADGDAPVQAYIAAMPGWKRDLGRQLDALIMQAVPGACKAVKWNSPLYGIEGQGWFLGVHCFTKYLKVAFFQGVSLKPLPPVESKDKNTRYFHIYEGEKLDTAQLLLKRAIIRAKKVPSMSSYTDLKRIIARRVTYGKDL